MVRGFIVILIVIITVVTSGCQSVDEQKIITLTVNYPSERIFFERVGYAFESKYPNIRIKVTENVSENQVSDIVFMRNNREYQEAISKGILLNLNQYFTKSKREQMQLSDISTSMLRWEEDSGLYGLSPAFSNYVIYYNKKMFNHYSLPYPSNQMKWEEILNLAQLFPNSNESGDKLYGFKSNYYEFISFATFLRVGQTEGLSFIDPTTLKININTAKWKEIGEYIINAFRGGNIYSDIDENSEKFVHSPIFTGQAAMELSSQTTAYNFEKVHKQYQLEEIDWGMVTVPVDPLNPEYSDYYQLNEIYGISNSSVNQEEAWSFIEFITSDVGYYKKNKSQIMNYGVPSKLDLLEPIGDHDLSPLYLLKPAISSNNPYEKVHFEIINNFKEIGQSLFDQVLSGSLSLDEAFERLEQLGQITVDETKKRLEDEGEVVFLEIN
ncbi:extracellular solute-binding protein [Paenibacillus luteus]|uniref:extracellular solute-binding protein n=1 Tax=Paenibacillus luteus TaxID=2545753 RepID=UPI001141E091|nr:extracellular solute-binding protein [Paenibacillus luteus]